MEANNFGFTHMKGKTALPVEDVYNHLENSMNSNNFVENALVLSLEGLMLGSPGKILEGKNYRIKYYASIVLPHYYHLMKYLSDNNKTSFMDLVSAGTGLMIATLEYALANEKIGLDILINEDDKIIKEKENVEVQ